MVNMIKYGSLFTGAEGFDLGFNNAGMKCEWQVEIDKFCQAVLKYNSPNTEKFTDVRKVGKENLRPVDLVCGGFPCQDLSVAGKRNGLDGERSGLWFEFARIIAELKPAWVVIENVPGLLSSNKGEDFAVILRWLGECGHYASWRILDSQYWGIAQRRRRLFIVGSLGNTSCIKVLFESEGMPWNPQKGRKEGERVAATISSRTKGRGYGDEEISGNLVAATETGAGFWNEGKPRLRCSTAPGQPQTIVTFPIQSPEKGEMQQGGSGIGNNGDPSYTIVGQAEHGVVTNKNYGEPRVVGSLTRASSVGGTVTHQDCKSGHLIAESPAAEPGMKQQNYICLNPEDPQTKRVHAGELSPTISGSDGKGGQRTPYHLMSNMAVRRLTPRECERLQGMPDDFTRWGINEKGEKIEISDSQRYKMAGNMVTRSVAEWIGRRIVEVSKP